MPKRIDELTPEQHAAMASHADKWIARGLDLSPVDWAAWEKGARACYAYAGVPFPERVVRVPSPLVGAVAAPLAAYIIGLKRRDAVGDAVDGAVGDAVGDAVDGAVGDAVGDAVDGAVGGAVRGAVRDAVGGAVGDAVRDAVGDAVLRGAWEAIRRGWMRRLWGQHWTNWQAWVAFFRDEAGLELDGDLWERSYAYEQASTAGWWWPYRDFVMVVDRPVQIHREQVGPTGWGSHRLHREDGPAISWSDGYALHFWHGTHVPADLIEGDGWTVEQIMREPNAEIRRCAIEKLGWNRFIDQAQLQQVGATVADPGNPGNTLALYDIPARLYDEPVRVLLCQNGTVERDGTRRRFGLTVPGSISDPIAAAGWGYGLNPAQYALAQRRA